MNVQSSDVQQRLNFIDLTISHAVRACCSDTRVPQELKDFVHLLGVHSTQARQALCYCDAATVREKVEHLARLSDRAQHTIHPSDDFNYDVKSAVILAHIEVSALRLQLD